MICIYTGDDCSYCTCSACASRRTSPVLEQGYRTSQVPARPFLHHRRRPCPTGLPGSLDGVVPYQPSRCAKGCTCCGYCRGEPNPLRAWCTCPIGPIPASNCERGHSGLVECRGGCKPRPIAMAVVVQRWPWGKSLLGKVWSAVRDLARWSKGLKVKVTLPMAIVMASLITTLVSALAFAAAESDGALKILWVVLAGWVIHEFARVWSRP